MRREHVHFIDQIDFVSPLAGCVTDVLEQFTGVINLRSASSIHFKKINKAIIRNGLAIPAFATGCCRDTGFAIQTPRQNSSNGGLSDATGPGKQIRMMQPTGVQCVRQRLADVLLTD